MKEQPKQEIRTMPHLLTLSERSMLTVSGVRDVDSFDESTVVAYTDLGELTVKGNGLHIDRLNIETGDMTVAGTVESLVYAELHNKSGGFFGKLFR